MTEVEQTESTETPPKRPRLSEEEHKSLVQKLRIRKKLLSKIPQLYLAEIGRAACLEHSKESRVPIFPAEVQSLITYAVVGDESRNFPFTVFKITKWTSLTSVTVLAVDNVGVDDYENNPEFFPHVNQIFKHKMEMSNPTLSKGNSSVSLAYIPLTISHIYSAAQACKTLDNAVKWGYIHNIKNLLNEDESDDDSMESEINKAVVLKRLQYQSAKYNQGKRAGHDRRLSYIEDPGVIRGDEVGLCGDVQSSAISVETESPIKVALKGAEENATSCSRLDLLLNRSQIVQEKIPVPGMLEFQGFIMTSSEYKPVSDSSPMFSIDCEWVLCRGGIKALARIAVVNERLECAYHTLVKPILPVSDYLTKYSGVTGKMLNHVQTTLKDVQRDLLKLLPPDAIIVGQAVGGDLIALELFHPYIIDTSVIYNLTGQRVRKTKLSMLTEIFLKRKIQMATDGHSPIEDAAAAMELVLLKLKMGKDYGDTILNPERNMSLPTGDDLFRIKFSQLNELFQKVDHKMSTEEEKIYDTSCRLHQKLFTFLESHNISSLLITGPKFIDHYKPTIHLNYQPHLMAKKSLHNYCGPVRIVEADSVKSALKEAIANSGREKLTLVHTEVNGDVQSSEKRRKKLKKLDKAIGKVFQNMTVNGLLIVIFSGTQEPLQNGVCFVRVNQEHIDLTGLTTDNQPQTSSHLLS